MKVGMLWFDDNKDREIGSKIERAIQHYLRKYGQRPTVCYVHPANLMGVNTSFDGIKVKASNSVLPHHFWIGEEETIRKRAAA